MVMDLFIKHKKIFFYVVGFWVIFYGAVFYISDLQWKFPPSLSLNSLGLFGDSFNVLTSLFTGLAFAGVIVSVILQTQELKETRKEFKGQKEALEKQQKEMANQSFDNKFFQMLHLLNSIVESLSFIGSVQISREQVKTRKEYQKDVFVSLKNEIEKRMFEVSEEYFFEVFKKFNNAYDVNFKYYFINLYQILKYIDKEYEDDYDVAKEYTNIVRAQLPKDALVLLFYNAIGVTSFTEDKYKKLVEKYSFFEHLRYDDLDSGELAIVYFLLKQYDLNAFGKNEDIKSRIKEIQP